MEELRPKVRALYRAVLELLDEGADINNIKVSEITRKAGIGKGTAYDYFKSREEIIVGALFYDLEREMGTEQETLRQFDSFAAKMEYAFDWIERRFREQKSFMRVLRLTTQKTEISGSLLEEFKKRKDFPCRPIRILGDLCREGKERGEIREEIPVDAACLTALSSLAAFVMFLEAGEHIRDVDPKWMKAFLQKGLLNQLK